MVRILLADDHSIVRSGIMNLLMDNIMTVTFKEAHNGFYLTEQVKAHDFDLVLLDINMPDMDFITIIPWILKIRPNCGILVFSSYPENTYGIRALQCGAHGYLNKTASNDQIIQAVNTILSGKRFIGAALAELMVDQLQGKEITNPLDLLSTREMEISRLLQKGISLPEIGKQLNLGYTTVITYKNRIFGKLHVDNVVNLARIMRAHGLAD